MSGEKSKNGTGAVICILICAAAVLSVVLSLLEYSMPAIVGFVIALIVAERKRTVVVRHGPDGRTVEIDRHERQCLACNRIFDDARHRNGLLCK